MNRYEDEYDYAQGEVVQDEQDNQGMRIVSPEEVQEAKRAGHLFIQLMRKVRSGMTHRDRQFFEMGLRAAHMEEALATGEVERGEEHFKKLLEVASHILTVRMEAALAEGDYDGAEAQAEKMMRLEGVRRRMLL